MTEEQQSLQNRLSYIQAIPREDLQRSSIPIDVYLREARVLYDSAQEDFQQLSSVGLTQEWVDELLPRFNALSAAQSNWIQQFQAKKDAQAEWAEKSPALYELRSELLRWLRFAARNNQEAQTQLNTVEQGSGHEDTIQDLSDLVALAQRYSDALAMKNFNFAKLDEASAMVTEMWTLLAAADGDRLDGNQARVLRDQAYMYLKMAVDEVRDHGRFVFYDNDHKLRRYQSSYVRSKNKRRDEQKEAGSDQPQAT